MKLHIYFAKRYLKILMSILGVFSLFLFLIDFIEQTRRFSSKVSFPNLIELTLLNTPQALYEMFPLIVILASVSLFIALSRSSELVIARAVGRSAVQSVFAPAVVMLTVGALGVAIFNPIVAATSVKYDQMQSAYVSGKSSAISLGREGLWLRQGDSGGQTVIHAKGANATGLMLYDVTFIAFHPSGAPSRRLQADVAELKEGYWRLGNARTWPLIPGINAQDNMQIHESLVLTTTLSAEQISDRFGQPQSISIWDMPAYITQLEDAGFSARRYQIWMHTELALPLFLTAMLLVGAAFTMRPTRLGGIGIRVLSAIVIGFSLYYIKNFAQILAENGQLSILIAAWVPPLASLLLALGILLLMEEG